VVIQHQKIFKNFIVNTAAVSATLRVLSAAVIALLI